MRAERNKSRQNVDISINPKFKNLIPPLTQDERKQLEENILDEGIREPLITWNGILIDGHNRYSIAKKFGLEFQTKEMDFENESDAEIWIIKNQFGRRNLSKYDRSILALRLKPVIAERAKQNERLGGKGSQKSVNHKTDTQKEIAKLAGVSHDTIHRVETIEASGNDKVREKLRSGEISINEAYLAVTPKPKSGRQEAKEARERHNAFLEKKNSDQSVVSFRDIKEDAYDVKIIAREYFSEIETAIKKVTALSLFRDSVDVESVIKTFGKQDMEQLGKDIDDAVKVLNFLKKKMLGG